MSRGQLSWDFPGLKYSSVQWRVWGYGLNEKPAQTSGLKEKSNSEYSY